MHGRLVGPALVVAAICSCADDGPADRVASAAFGSEDAGIADRADAAPAAPTPTVAAAAGAADSGGQRSADPAEFRAPWCTGPGQDALARIEVMYWITSDYESARGVDCETAGLLPVLSEELRMAWWDYLIGYSAALAGCPPFPVEVPGGILEFGPAHTMAIGLPHPRLGRDDVSRLISKYMTGFAARLSLTTEESQLVETHLWRTAEPDMDPDASGVLSTCGATEP